MRKLQPPEQLDKSKAEKAQNVNRPMTFSCRVSGCRGVCSASAVTELLTLKVTIDRTGGISPGPDVDR